MIYYALIEKLFAGGICELKERTDKGYRPSGYGDELSEAGINRFIRTVGVFRVETRSTVTSTNTELRQIAERGAPEGCVLAAGEQTAGKGRIGRSFHSPAGSGAYFSLLLRPGRYAANAALITSAAAVAAAKAIADVTGIETGIKWVNDLFTGGKKVGGILTETVSGMQNGVIESAILGIGINIIRPDEGFPGTLEEIAGALYQKETGVDSVRSRLIAATLDIFWEYYIDLENRDFLEDYRARSIVLGKDISVISGNREQPARAVAIDDDCGLVVRYESGDIETLRSGEVSVRGIG